MIRLSLSRRERYIFIVVIVTIISAIFYNFIWEPIYKKWGALNNEIVIKKTRFRKAQKLIKDQNKIINEYNSYAASLKDISRLLSLIERQATSSRIKTANIRPQPGIQKELYKKYLIELQIEGEFLDIKNFISKLIDPPIFITVNSLDLRRVSESSSSLKGTLILSKLII